MIVRVKISKITSQCKFDERLNDVPTESVHLGFQQLIQDNEDQHLPQDSTEITSTDLDFLLTHLWKKKLLLILFILKIICHTHFLYG